MEPDRDARLWAVLAHLAALAAVTSIPLAHILGPLVVWLIKRQEHPFVDDQGKEALNFQISLTIYALVGAAVLVPLAILGAVVPGAPGIVLIPIAVLAGVALITFALVMIIVGAMRANEGVAFRYPLTLRLIR